MNIIRTQATASLRNSFLCPPPLSSKLEVWMYGCNFFIPDTFKYSLKAIKETTQNCNHICWRNNLNLIIRSIFSSKAVELNFHYKSHPLHRYLHQISSICLCFPPMNLKNQSSESMDALSSSYQIYYPLPFPLSYNFSQRSETQTRRDVDWSFLSFELSFTGLSEVRVFTCCCCDSFGRWFSPELKRLVIIRKITIIGATKMLSNKAK